MWLPDALGPIKGLAILAQNNDRSIYVKYSKINLEPESRTAKRVLTNLNNVFNSFSILARQHVGARVLPGAIWAFFFLPYELRSPKLVLAGNGFIIHSESQERNLGAKT